MANDPRRPLQRLASILDGSDDLVKIAGFFGGAIVAGLITALAYGACFSDCWLGGVGLWALALLACGAGVGFLFGIPKVLQNPPVTTQPAVPTTTAPPVTTAPVVVAATANAPAITLAYQQRVNTNLEEISDWLTKIIVGLGLVQLNTIPDRVWRLSTVITTSVGKDVPPGFGTGLILFFTITGFLFGYLITRLYLQGALARAERLVELMGKAGMVDLEEQSELAVQQVNEKIERAEAIEKAAPAGAAPADAPTADQQLQTLADEYMNVSNPGRAARVNAKNDLTARMAALVVRAKVSRDSLAKATHEGLLIALAAASHFAPEVKDTDRLIAAAANVKRWHVKYRFVMAFSRLFELGFVDTKQRAQIGQVLAEFEKDADDPLRLAIAGLRTQLGTAA